MSDPDPAGGPQPPAPSRIAELNDQLRRGVRGPNDRILITSGIQAQGQAFVDDVLDAVASFADFSEENDPHGEHDFGAFDLEGERIFFKIDYYDLTMTAYSPNPADPMVTARVLTIMLATEY